MEATIDLYWKWNVTNRQNNLACSGIVSMKLKNWLQYHIHNTLQQFIYHQALQINILLHDLNIAPYSQQLQLLQIPKTSTLAEMQFTHFGLVVTCISIDFDLSSDCYTLHLFQLRLGLNFQNLYFAKLICSLHTIYIM